MSTSINLKAWRPDSKWEFIPKNRFNKPQKSPFSIINDNMNDLLKNTFELVNNLNKIAITAKTNDAMYPENNRLDYHKYITPSDPSVNALAKKITNSSDSDDKKIYDIEQWVQKNIKYVADDKNYGQLEYWAYPAETLERKSGDCEDQAFLIHSLGLAAGIEPERLRTYGGLVFVSNSRSLGGHGWTAYKREKDNEWVVVDSTYYAVQTPISEREPLPRDLKYVDDFWYVQAGRTVATPYVNKVRYAVAEITKGMFINIKI